MVHNKSTKESENITHQKGENNMTKKEYENLTEEFLNEKYDILTNMEHTEIQGVIQKVVYETAIKTVERLGYSWKRNENGEHKIFVNY